VYYRGPRRPGGDLPRIKIDLTGDEVLVYAPVRRSIDHQYTDGLPDPHGPLCYSLPELFGEKLRALAERCLPRDVYDVVNVFRRADARGAAAVVFGVLQEKCRYKEIGVPTFATIDASPRRAALDTDWEQMLGHQLPELPPLTVLRRPPGALRLARRRTRRPGAFSLPSAGRGHSGMVTARDDRYVGNADSTRDGPVCRGQPVMHRPRLSGDGATHRAVLAPPDQ
jgi:hypothetical protein